MSKNGGMVVKSESLANVNAGFRYSLLDMRSQVVVDPEFNSRTQYDAEDNVSPEFAALSAKKIGELATSAKLNGYTPLVGRDMPDGKVFLIAGFRRAKAAEINGDHVLPFMHKTMTDEEAVRWNIIENTARKGLDPYELAMGVGKYLKVMEGSGVSRKGGRAANGEGATGWSKWISDKLTMSQSAVKLYLRLLTNLHPQILKAWGDPTSKGHTFCSVNHLNDLAKIEDKAEQLAVFLAEVRRNDGPTPDPDSPDSPDAPDKGPDKPRMISFALAAQCLAHFEELAKKGPAKDRESVGNVVATLRFCMGQRESVGGYNPAKENEKAKEAAKLAKETERAGKEEEKEAAKEGARKVREAGEVAAAKAEAEELKRLGLKVKPVVKGSHKGKSLNSLNK